MEVFLTVHRDDGGSDRAPLLCRIDTLDEVEYYRSGGILQYVLQRLAAA
jgi:aconitate hydratase